MDSATMIPTAADANAPFAVPRFQRSPPTKGIKHPEVKMVYAVERRLIMLLKARATMILTAQTMILRMVCMTFSCFSEAFGFIISQ